jgi:RNA polymerase sigma factor (sigma-70 family)
VPPTFELEENEPAVPGDVASEAIERLSLSAAVRRLDDRSQDLLALRFGADLSARQIGEVLGLQTNAVEVALHRTLARLRSDFERENQGESLKVTPSPDILN